MLLGCGAGFRGTLLGRALAFQNLLYFEVRSAAGRRVARSEPFQQVCNSSAVKNSLLLEHEQRVTGLV